MVLNKKILRMGLILIVISLILTVGFALAYSLKKPVFLKMYFEQDVYSNEGSDTVENFAIKYITNTSDNRNVVDISFKEEPSIKVTVSHSPIGAGAFSFFYDDNYNTQRGARYGRYALHTIYLNMDLNDIDKEFYEVELNNVKVKFDDGSVLDTNIGRIIIYKDENKNEDIVYINSSSSSDGTSNSQGYTKKYIKLLEVKSPLSDDLKDYSDISVGYSENLEAKYEKSKILNIDTKFETPDNIVGKYTFYNMIPKLYYEDEEGNISYVRIDNIYYAPHDFDLKGIINYLSARGAI